MRVGEHQVLHRELDVDHAAGIVLDVEQAGLVRVRGVHLLAHRDNVRAKTGRSLFLFSTLSRIASKASPTRESPAE